MFSHDSPQRTDETIVAVPCFNEAKRLPTHNFSEFLDRSPSTTITFVDDGSTDDTPLVLERLRQRHPRQICTLRLSENVGKAEAVRRAMQVALRRRPTFIGYWDADLATPLNAIPRFVDVLQNRRELDLVMGSRVALLGRDIQRSTLRHIAGRVFATAASFVLQLPVYDTQCGAKLFRATQAFKEHIAQPFRARWIFDVEILARMIRDSSEPRSGRSQSKIYEYPLEQWRDVGGSRLKFRDFVVAALDLAAIYQQYRRRSVKSAAPLVEANPLPTPILPQRTAA